MSFHDPLTPAHRDFTPSEAKVAVTASPFENVDLWGVGGSVEATSPHATTAPTGFTMRCQDVERESTQKSNP
ncbi:unnamed protein product, partial [Chrysoparadoxa australica]